MTKLILPLIVVLVLLLGACTPRHCPTYSQTKWDTVAATHADLIAYMHADTTPHRFTFIEKAGAVVLIGLFITQFKKQHDLDRNDR